MAAIAALLVVVLAVRQVRRATTVEIWTAKQELKAGQKLEASLLERTRVAKSEVPAGVIRDAGAMIGKVLAMPVAQGAPLTMQEFETPAGKLWLSDAPKPGRAVMTVPLGGSSPLPVKTLRMNDRLDIIASNGKGDPEIVARDAHFIGALSSPRREATGGSMMNELLASSNRKGGGGGGTSAIVISVRQQDVSSLAKAIGFARLSYAVLGRNEPPYVPALAIPKPAEVTVDLIQGGSREKVNVIR
jgi:hypothetical protein